jgi:hypothetical protein
VGDWGSETDRVAAFLQAERGRLFGLAGPVVEATAVQDAVPQLSARLPAPAGRLGWALLGLCRCCDGGSSWWSAAGSRCWPRHVYKQSRLYNVTLHARAGQGARLL